MTASDVLGEAHARRKNVRFWHALVWLLVGALLYAVALAGVMLLYPDPQDALAPVVGPSLYLTPLFGTPYLLVSARQRGWLKRVLYFTVVLTTAHIVANYLAWQYGVANFQVEPDASDYARDLATGAIGGFSGAVLAFAFLLSMRMARWTLGTRAIVLLAILVLTLLAALGMAQGLALTHALELQLKPARFIIWYECVHLTWQAALAFFLAWLMRLRPRPLRVEAPGD